ncbi:universal stress protein UspG [Halorubrum luteum]
MYETALVSVDGSEESLTAAREAVEFVDDDGTLHVLSVVEQLPMHKRSGRAEKFEDDEETRAQAESAVSEVEDVVESAGVDYAPAIEEGVPRHAIVSYADEVDADVVVVGKRGSEDVANDLLGSTAEYVVRNASVPVVTVPNA